MSEEYDNTYLMNQLEIIAIQLQDTKGLAADFPRHGNSKLCSKVNRIVAELANLQRMTDSVKDVMVPIEVFDYIDQGMNPQLFTKAVMEGVAEKKKEIKAKIDGFREFKAHLLMAAGKTFPKEFNYYRAYRMDDKKN